MSTSNEPSTVASSGAPDDYQLLLPEGWFRINLEPERREASIDALVERQFRGIEDAPHLKRQTRADLLKRAQDAYDNGGIELYLSLQQAGPLTIPASLLLTLAAPELPGGVQLEVLAQHLFDRGPLDQDVSIEKLQAGEAVRVRTRTIPPGNDSTGNTAAVTSVDYHVPIPDATAILLLSFSTPLDPLADVMVKLFDAIAHSLTWTGRGQ